MCVSVFLVSFFFFSWEDTLVGEGELWGRRLPAQGADLNPDQPSPGSNLHPAHLPVQVELLRGELPDAVAKFRSATKCGDLHAAQVQWEPERCFVPFVLPGGAGASEISSSRVKGHTVLLYPQRRGRKSSWAVGGAKFLLYRN